MGEAEIPDRRASSSSSATAIDSPLQTEAKLQLPPRAAKILDKASQDPIDIEKESGENWEHGHDISIDSEEEGAAYPANPATSRTEEGGDCEEGPLLDDVDEMSGQASIKGRTEWMRMVMLCTVHLGVTFTWGVEMTYCTPYLLNLGLTKSQTSLVWVAGPLSGLIVQPIVGVMADSNRSRFGRRRPYIFFGSIIVAASLITLGWTKEIVSLVMATDTDFAKMFIIFLAVSALYMVDFAINAVMSTARSLLVDTLPIAKQQSGAAWAGRLGSLGHIIGYSLGAVDLPGLFGTSLGDTQFKQLTLIAALGMLLTAGITCWAVTERVLVNPRREMHGSGRWKVVRQIWSTLLDLPPRIQGICWAVFWMWIGWYPFNVYSSTWVGETYFRYDVANEVRAESSDALGDMGRIGSYTLTIYSFMTFTGAWLLPLFVRGPEDEHFTARPPKSIAPFLERFNKMKPDLLTVWVAGHLLFAGAMIFAPFAHSFQFATTLVVFCGIPWSIVTWAPTATLGIEVNRLSGGNATAAYRRLSSDGTPAVELTRTDSLGSPTGHGGGEDSLLHQPHNNNNDANDGSGELSGIYFGILNIYQTIPQFIGTFISTVVFAILEPGKSPELATDANPSEHHSTDGPNAISVCLFIGAWAAMVAAFVTRRLKYI